MRCLSEPQVGNPPNIRKGGRLISQDLANSVLEYQSIANVAKGTVCELGGGYGRNAFVTASLAPVSKYIMVDISPAFGVSQEYLRAVFPDKRHFPFRDQLPKSFTHEWIIGWRGRAACQRNANVRAQEESSAGYRTQEGIIGTIATSCGTASNRACEAPTNFARSLIHTILSFNKSAVTGFTWLRLLNAARRTCAASEKLLDFLR